MVNMRLVQWLLVQLHAYKGYQEGQGFFNTVGEIKDAIAPKMGAEVVKEVGKDALDIAAKGAKMRLISTEVWSQTIVWRWYLKVLIDGHLVLISR